MKRVGVLVYDGVEELDFAGPYEVFGMADRIHPGSFHAFTASEVGREIRGIHGLRVRPDYSFRRSPKAEVLVVPGGPGSRREMKNRRTLEFVKKSSKSCLVALVCTGALILAAAGLLDGKRATTHWDALDELKKFPTVNVEHRRYIRQGRIVTSAGVSSGIDMALYLVGLFQGQGLRRKVAKRMEYREP